MDTAGQAERKENQELDTHHVWMGRKGERKRGAIRINFLLIKNSAIAM